MIRCQKDFWKLPEPIPENSTDYRWKWFKNCLGALDGTYIRVKVPEQEKPKYRTRKGEIATNVLGVCSQDLQFIYVLAGWEGSAHDSRVLKDALSRRNGLKVPNGYYYLVDAGYTNGTGFLAPFRGQRYHLNDWRDGHRPETPNEFFNMKHSSARNVIERREMALDPIEHQVDNQLVDGTLETNDYIGTVESSDEWSVWRQNLANEMWNTWNGNRE
ncbi:uncharacterized protein LOC110755830 [Prunus avium]|uniref:Uncharacterized protein LOC110755830 n=1 Tax=Prunus avium TaxID=42229 RepID=A0A6P5S735_PRUAV|nr:uncharacterized protein LOC110755830 [Prunus avium]